MKTGLKGQEMQGRRRKGLKNRVEVAKGRKCRGEGERAKE